MLYERWRQICNQYGPQMALRDLSTHRQWTFAELAAQVENISAPVQPITYPQGHSADFIFTVLQAWRWNAVVCPLEPGQTPPKLPIPPSGCIHLKTTSATTGTPRLVAFTASQLAADADNIVATMGLRPDWPNLGIISLAHSYGFSNLVLPLLLHGIPLILVSSPLPEVIRRATCTEPHLTLPAVPALWNAWHQAQAIPPGTRLAISAGAPLSLQLEREIFDAHGIKIHNFYGSTECGGIAYDTSAQPRTDHAFVGCPMLNVRLSLNEVGCLRVHSGAAGETYWPLPDSTLGSGQFQTSDLAEIEQVRVYLRGRLTDQINIAGRKIAPAMIENALLAHPAVRDCLVFSVPSSDLDRRETIVGCVVAQAPVTFEDLKHFLLGKLPAWQVPRDWWQVESLTTNHRGKISRAQWRERYLEKTLQKQTKGTKNLA